MCLDRSNLRQKCLGCLVRLTRLHRLVRLGRLKCLHRLKRLSLRQNERPLLFYNFDI